MTRRLMICVAGGAALALSLAFISVARSTTPHPLIGAAGSREAGPNCHAVKLVAARGSGDTLNSFGVIGTKISGALARRANAASVNYGAYGLPYTAVGIEWTRGLTVSVLYQLSKNGGRDKLRAFIKQQVRDCRTQRLVLLGYSQGAHVVGDVLSRNVGALTANELSHIGAVALVADPRFNSREQFSSGSFRPGRNGLLGARSPGDLDAVKGRIKSWCRRDDLVCQGPGNMANHRQDRYLADYSEQIISFIASALAWNVDVSRYRNHIVQWDGDKKAQKTSWLVGADLRRRWIPSVAVYNCLKSRGAAGPAILAANVLDRLPDLAGVAASCVSTPPPPPPPPPPGPQPPLPPPPAPGNSPPVITAIDGAAGVVRTEYVWLRVSFRDPDCDVVGGTWEGADGSNLRQDFGAVDMVCAQGSGQLRYARSCLWSGQWTEYMTLLDARGNRSPRVSFTYTCV